MKMIERALGVDVRVKKELSPPFKIEISQPYFDAANRAQGSMKQEFKAGSVTKHVRAHLAMVSPTAIDLLDKLLGIDVRTRLHDYSNLCIATAKTTSQRCQIHIRKENGPLLLATLSELSVTKVSSDSAKIAEKIEDFIELACCGCHHRASCLAKVHEWREQTACHDKVVGSKLSKSSTVISASEYPVQLSETAQQAKPSRPVKVKREDLDLSDSNVITSPQKLHSAASWTSCYDLRPTTSRVRNMQKYVQGPKFIHSVASPTVTTNIHIYKAMKRPLTKTALESGYIYVYRIPGESGLFKIGYTTVGVRQRLRKWENDCGHKIELVYPTTKSESAPIKHVFRVEQLVHAELKAYRYKEKACARCGDDHVEWFKVSEELIRAVIAKWTAWIERSPYMEVDGAWLLTKTENEEMDALCLPLEIPNVEPEAAFEPKVLSRKSTLIRSVATRILA